MPILSIPAAAPNFMRGRQGRQVSLIVLHTTVGTMDATLATFQNPNRIASAHYVVGLDGQVVNMVAESDTAYHAGNWEVNLTSIGIEHVDDGDYNGPRTPELYAASSALVGDLCARYGIPQDRANIRKHSEVSDNPTGCPDGLDVDRIVGGSGSLGDDMTPDQEAKLDAVSAGVRFIQGALFWSDDPKVQPYDPTFLPQIRGFVARLKAALSPANVTVDNTAVLAAIADLKAHPATADPAVLALVQKIEKALQGA